MSRLFLADQLCRRQCSLYSAYNQASVDLRSWLIPLSGNVFAYGYSNTWDYAIKWYAIKRAYLAQKGYFLVLLFAFCASKWDMQLSGMRLSGLTCIVLKDGTNQWHNVSNIHDIHLYWSTNFLNDPRS